MSDRKDAKPTKAKKCKNCGNPAIGGRHYCSNECHAAFGLANGRTLGSLAHAAVNAAVARGELVRPQKCSRCGLGPVGGSQIEGHHHNGYEAGHWLDVEWLCNPCHGGHRRHDSEPGHPCVASRKTVISLGGGFKVDISDGVNWTLTTERIGRKRPVELGHYPNLVSAIRAAYAKGLENIWRVAPETEAEAILARYEIRRERDPLMGNVVRLDPISVHQT